MFTGIISALGTVSEIGNATANQFLLKIDSPYTDIQRGESIAVNGVCLTATEIELHSTGSRLHFFVSSETAQRSNLGDLQTKARVSLERALRLQDRLSGHLVQGHVDGIAKLTAVHPIGDCHELEVELPPLATRYIIQKGSIALDGISLTINSIKNSKIYLMIIPHTWEQTHLSTKQIGQNFNFELDMIAKHLEVLIKPYS